VSVEVPIHIDPRSGLVSGVRRIASPNFDARPDGVAVDVLVIHSISLPPGECGGDDIEQLFCNRLDPGRHPFFQNIADLTVSAHLLIRRDGAIVQFVPFTQRAWHAGVSEFAGRERVNDFSIGIELEGSDSAPFEEPQYASLISVTRALRAAYPAITPDRIVGHSDIAPTRKTDPGPYFNWARYRRAVA
jgi:AmpD protein